jgi:hypothetical protein
LEEKDLSELSIEELDTDYQILFDMHQEMCKVRSKMNGLGRCKGLESYQNSRKLIETLIGNISESLEIILDTSIRRTLERGFI